MVFKRTGASTYAFQARLPNGRYKQLQTGAPFGPQGKALAQRIESMWTSLALEHRAWDLLEPVLRASRGERASRLGRLYDLWLETRFNPGEMRRRLDDRNIEPLVAEWSAWYEGQVKPDSGVRDEAPADPLTFRRFRGRLVQRTVQPMRNHLNANAQVVDR